jgi:hypothetical protein
MIKDRYLPLVRKVRYTALRQLRGSIYSFTLIFRVQLVVLLTKVFSTAVIGQATKDWHL